MIETVVKLRFLDGPGGSEIYDATDDVIDFTYEAKPGAVPSQGSVVLRPMELPSPHFNVRIESREVSPQQQLSVGFGNFGYGGSVGGYGVIGSPARILSLGFGSYAFGAAQSDGRVLALSASEPQASDSLAYGFDGQAYSSSGMPTTSYSGEPVTTITLDDCIVISSNFDRSPAPSVSIEFLDRRWNWQYGHIDGAFNLVEDDPYVSESPYYVRNFYNFLPSRPGRDNGEEFVEMNGRFGRKIVNKTIRELYEYVFEQTDEFEVDYSSLDDAEAPLPNPNNAIDYLNGLEDGVPRLSGASWKGESPATVISELVKHTGYSPAIGVDGRVFFLKAGEGDPPPVGDEVTVLQVSTERPPRPANLRIATNYVRYECEMELEPVGIEVTGDIKPIDDLSYKPEQGWASNEIGKWSSVFGRTANGTLCRDLAVRSVYRLFRVKKMLGRSSGFAPPDYVGDAAKIEKLSQVLPLLPYGNYLPRQKLNDKGEPVKDEIEIYQTDDPRLNAPPAVALGRYYNLELGETVGTKGSPAKVLVDFTVIGDLGLVRFNRPIFDVDTTEKKLIDPYLVLRTSVIVDHDDDASNMKQYYGYTIPTGVAGGAGVAVVQVPELFPQITTVYKNAGTERTKDKKADNLERIREKSIQRVADMVREMTISHAYTVNYRGLWPIPCSGIVNSVRWSVGFGKPPSTTVLVGYESEGDSPGFREQNQQLYAIADGTRRRRERVESVIRDRLFVEA